MQRSRIELNKQIYSRVSQMLFLKRHDFSFVSGRNLFSQQSRIPRISRSVVCHAVPSIVAMIQGWQNTETRDAGDWIARKKEIYDEKLSTKGTS